MKISFDLVLEQFKKAVLRHSKMISLVTRSSTKAISQPVGLMKGRQKGDCNINSTELSK
jgi:hypothetical protein